MKNVTVTLDDTVARWLRVRAAEADASVSKYLADLVRDHRQAVEDYATAERRYLGRPAFTAKRTSRKREDLYDRPVLRRHEPSGLCPRPR